MDFRKSGLHVNSNFREACDDINLTVNEVKDPGTSQTLGDWEGESLKKSKKSQFSATRKPTLFISINKEIELSDYCYYEEKNNSHMKVSTHSLEKTPEQKSDN
jgi:hypothetical protein